MHRGDITEQVFNTKTEEAQYVHMSRNYFFQYPPLVSVLIFVQLHSNFSKTCSTYDNKKNCFLTNVCAGSLLYRGQSNFFRHFVVHDDETKR